MEKRKANIEYRNNRINYSQYKTSRNRTNNEIREVKLKFWEKFSIDMEHDISGGQRRVLNMLRNRRKPVNEYVQICNIIKESWENYFENLYRKINTSVQVEEITPEEQV
ncbi:hypothetical protein M0802_015537 [Mischocyttarus mexicanus]|nr:hypothetical protein M0802_015537 [Mischocyttarus mexicanus]